MYCEKCNTLFDGGCAACPACGSKETREPTQDDDCFVVEKEAIWGEMLADVLKQNGIPFIYKKALGAALATKIGSYRERYRFYVPYAQVPAAQSIVEELFTPVADE